MASSRRPAAWCCVPEGQSLALAAQRLRPLVGEEVTEGALEGSRISAVESHGKQLLIRSEDGRTLRVHLGMHGAVRLRPAGTGSGRHVLRTAAGDAVIHHPTRYAVQRSALVRITSGPDLLGDFDEQEFLRRARLIDRPVGEMVMDQRVLAGIGNIVKSETLWRTRTDPFARVSTLDDDRLREIARVAADVLREGVAARGPLSRAIYKRAGRPCPRCRTPIRMARQGENLRSTYWCPGCQS
jgi:endonuclease-8